MILRWYQQEAHDAAIDWVKKSIEPCLLELPTGSGKSHIVAAIANTLHNVPFNKGLKNVNGTSNTTFKKGQVPYNLKPEGHERTDSEGYIYIKTKKGFVFKHRHIWEQAHGTIKKGMVLVFIDNDKTNCDLSNLVLVSRGELAILNRCQRFGEVTGALKLAMIYNVRLEKRIKECQ